MTSFNKWLFRISQRDVDKTILEWLNNQPRLISDNFVRHKDSFKVIAFARYRAAHKSLEIRTNNNKHSPWRVTAEL